MSKVYIAMAGDIIHQGHINIISEAAKKGDLTVGVLTDEVIGHNKRVPLMNFEQRKAIINSIKGVSTVVAQDTLEYTKNLEEIRPDFVFHGDDWKVGCTKCFKNTGH